MQLALVNDTINSASALQVGLNNVTGSSKGIFQLGVFNDASSSDCFQLGLVNINDKGFLPVCLLINF